MARSPHPHADPAADAAALLRRIGFATLMLVIPVTALVTRRAVVVLAPIGIVLLVIAALIDSEHRGVRERIGRLGRSPAALAGALILGWCMLSLLWTPFFAPAAERLFNIMATVAMAIAGYLALPERMRSANLYLVAIGVGAAALVAIGLGLSGLQGERRLDEDGQNLERGLIVLIMMLWPSVAWLRSRQRDRQALALAILVAFAAILGSPAMAFPALAIGVVAFAVTTASPRLGVSITAFVMAGLLALAPMVPFAVQALGAALPGPDPMPGEGFAVWRGVILGEPVRLITGHGFETALRGRLVGLLPTNAPNTLLFEVWYELGIVGALAGAVALAAAARGARISHPVLLPGAMAAFAAAFALACLGIGTAQIWWFTTLSIVVLVFVAAERGQFRTTRPKASAVRNVAGG